MGKSGVLWVDQWINVGKTDKKTAPKGGET
jgi:hypothetical protein